MGAGAIGLGERIRGVSVSFVCMFLLWRYSARSDGRG